MIKLTKEQFLIITDILHRHFPTAKIWFFGSRVNGNARKYSDLDVMIQMQDDKKQTFIDAKDEFEKSDLPFLVDLVNFDKVNFELRESVMESAVPLEQIIPN